MAKHIQSKSSAAAADEGVEVIAKPADYNFSSSFIGNNMSSFDQDPEMPTATDDVEHLTIDGLNVDDDNFDPPTNNTDNNRKKKWSIGAAATSILLAIVALIAVMKQPADDTSVASAAAANRVANNNFLSECCVNLDTNTCHATEKCNKEEKKCNKCNTNGRYAWTLPSGSTPPQAPPDDSKVPEPDTDGGGEAKKCCVNTDTGACHDKEKCNQNEGKCKKCTKNDDYAWMFPGGSVPVPPDSREPEDTDGGETPPDDEVDTPEEPCCAILSTKTCHEDDKCNQKSDKCLNNKCQKTGEAVWAVPSELTPVPTPVPTPAPTNSPTNSPTSAPSPTPTTGTPTSAPTTAAPTKFVDTTVYEYTETGTQCSRTTTGGGNNVQGPAPLPNKKNVVVDFWSWGDTPYDYLVDTCLDDSGNPSTCNYCSKENSKIDEMPFPNTCTFEGDDFNCVEDRIIPFINDKMDGGEGAFQVHLGDILKGTQGAANSRRCTEASFNSRKNLFDPAKNFLLINGDNESNECKGYDITKSSDPVRDMWRSKFGSYSFTNNFPAITGGGKPGVSRVEGNEEIFGFQYKNVAFFGLDYPDGPAHLTSEYADADLNAVFVGDTLDSDENCELKSIVIFSHVAPESSVENELDDYFTRCDTDLPVLTVVGNAHPKTYCLTKDGERLTLIVEAFQSGPALVSIVRDPTGGDYFHVADSDVKDTNTQCPNFS